MNYETIEMTDLASKSAQNKATFLFRFMQAHQHTLCRHTTKNKLSPCVISNFSGAKPPITFQCVAVVCYLGLFDISA